MSSVSTWPGTIPVRCSVSSQRTRVSGSSFLVLTRLGMAPVSIINLVSIWSPKADIVTVKASGKFLGFINASLEVLHPESRSHLPDVMCSAPPDPVISEERRISRIRVFHIIVFSFAALFNLMPRCLTILAPFEFSITTCCGSSFIRVNRTISSANWFVCSNACVVSVMQIPLIGSARLVIVLQHR